MVWKKLHLNLPILHFCKYGDGKGYALALESWVLKRMSEDCNPCGTQCSHCSFYLSVAYLLTTTEQSVIINKDWYLTVGAEWKIWNVNIKEIILKVRSKLLKLLPKTLADA